MQASLGQLSSQISETAQGSHPGGTDILRWPRNSSQVHVWCANHNTFLTLYFCLSRPEKKRRNAYITGTWLRFCNLKFLGVGSMVPMELALTIVVKCLKTFGKVGIGSKWVGGNLLCVAMNLAVPFNSVSPK